MDLLEYNKRLSHVQEEKSQLNEEIHELQHEKKNLLIQLQMLQNRLTSDEPAKEMNMEETVQLHCSRQLPQLYRRTFERHLLLSPIHDDRQSTEDIEYNNDEEDKLAEEIIQELNHLSLDQSYLLDLILRTVTKMNVYLHGTKKLVRDVILRENFDRFHL